MKTIIKKAGILAGITFCALLAASAVPVTFQVNMDYQITSGNFRPQADTVEARGIFNDWAAGLALTNSPANPNVYQGTCEVANPAPGATVEYKFVINGSRWEENLVGPLDNRSFVLARDAQVLPVVYFGDVWKGSPIPLTFRVDMSVQLAKTNFNPKTSVVEARGSFQALRRWKAGFVLTNTPASPNVYQGTYKIGLPPNSKIKYKFVYRDLTDITWESIPDRSFLVPGSASVMPIAFFNDESDSMVISAQAPEVSPASPQILAVKP